MRNKSESDSEYDLRQCIECGELTLQGNEDESCSVCGSADLYIPSDAILVTQHAAAPQSPSTSVRRHFFALALGLIGLFCGVVGGSQFMSVPSMAVASSSALSITPAMLESAVVMAFPLVLGVVFLNFAVNIASAGGIGR